MKSERLVLNFTRLVEILNALAWSYVAYFEEPQPPSTPADQILKLLPLTPFLVALFLLRREPSTYHWLLIGAVHQALAVVVFACAALFLFVEFPDTALVSFWLIVAGVTQVMVWRSTRRFVPDIRTRSGPHVAIRVGLVFLFAFGFLLLK